MKKLALYLLLTIPLFAQNYFSPVAPTGLPYIVILQQITINGQPPAIGTEIAVFDDTLCVGAQVIQDTNSNSLITWQGNSSLSLPGFTPGDSMKFYGYLPATGKVIPLTALFSTGDGTFASGTFSAVSLSFDEPAGILEETSRDGNRKVSVFPNPGNGDFMMRLSGFETGTCRVRIFSITGELVNESAIEINSGILEKKLNTSSRLPAGEYVLQVDPGQRPVFEKFIIVR